LFTKRRISNKRNGIKYWFRKEDVGCIGDDQKTKKQNILNDMWEFIRTTYSLY
jgi:hypothetical protein